MKTIIEKMQALAIILDKKAELHDALAVDHEMNKETEQGRNRRRRAASARFYAEVSREAAKLLTARAKRAGFVRPTWDEVLTHASDKFPKWPSADVLSWFNHFESVGWKVNTKPMVSWQHAAANGYRRWLKDNPQASERPAGGGKADPDGWREYLHAQHQPYKSFPLAPGWMRTEFQSQKAWAKSRE